MPTLLRQLQTDKDFDPGPPDRPTTSAASRNRSSTKMGINRTSQVRVEVRREFLRTTTKGTQDESYTNPETLPSIEVAYNAFQRTYPKFSETWAVDDLRTLEYFHLEESQHVCMDYCGFGLFSYYQQIISKATSSFGLAYISANLPTHALYGAADEGTVEFYIRKRVMDYLNINDTEYSMVFTASRGSAFKLLAESYPFHLNPRLLTVYDFESEAVSWMAECAKQKGAKILSACFKWPSLRIGTSHLKKLLQEKKRKTESAKGLFVFPVQSRMTGAKYSYQWMSEAQQNKWHVLLDASSLGPKDMDSLGLSLFRPDFIVSSFYKVFGTDPTGFGCLFIKNTAIHSLQNSSRARAVGMVRIVSLSNFTSDELEMKDSEDDSEVQHLKRSGGWRRHNGHTQSSFSGPYFPEVQPEVEIKHAEEESNHRAWKSWKRRGKMPRHNGEHPVHLPVSKGFMDGVSGIGDEDASEVQFVAQPSKSGHYSEMRTTEIEEEQPNRGSETGYNWELASRLYERSDDEIEELEGDQASEVGSSRFFTNSQWHTQGRVAGIPEQYKPIEFLSFGGKGISPIREVDAEDQDFEERWEGERCSKSIDAAKESGSAHKVLSDGGANEIDEDAVDLESNSVSDLSQFGGGAVEDAGKMRWDSSALEKSRLGSGSDLRLSGSEETPVFTVVNKGNEIEDLEESGDVLLNGELSNDVVERNVEPRTLSEAGSQELSDIETSSILESERREHVPTKGDSSSPERRCRVEHAWEEEKLRKPSRSPNIKLDNDLPSITTSVLPAATHDRHSKERSDTNDGSFDIADFHDTKDHDLGNGRSDLRSNRTLSRNVDFEDDMYSGRSSFASEIFESQRQPTALAEDIARLGIHDSDDESFFQSEYYSGSQQGSRYLVDDLQLNTFGEGEDGDTEDEYDDTPEAESQKDQGESIISCKGLDFADSLGLTKLNYRLRYLINWLVNSLLKLRHPGRNEGIPLVRIYGPKVKYDRGAAVSFNMFDWRGLLIQPGLVQRLADRCNISLGVGRLCNIVDPEMSPDFVAEKERLLGVDKTNQVGADNSPRSGKLDVGKSGGAGDPLTIPVVTAAMGFVTSFEDVYKLWSFLAKFLDADYVSKEVWRYHSLNQQIMVM